MEWFRRFRRQQMDSWYCHQFDRKLKASDEVAMRQGKDVIPRSDVSGTAPNPKGPASDRIAVVALYPTDAITFSIVHLLRALQACGFWILAVSTKHLPDQQRETILANCHHLVERHPIGRDFGSYRLGLRWLKEHGKLRSAKLLALVNDSLFYPASFPGQLQDFLKDDRPWYSLFECFEIHYHAQSFFQIFRRDLFTSPAFEDFWEHYVPYSGRKHTIHLGEVALSRCLNAAGYQAHVLYNSARVCSDTFKILSSTNPDPAAIYAVKQTMHKEYFEIVKQNKTSDIFETDDAALSLATAHELTAALSRHAEHRNPAHSIGLLCNTLYEAPLKRDMVWRHAIQLGTLLWRCQGFTPAEKEMMKDDLRMKGLPESLLHSKRLMALYRRERI